MNVKNPPKGSPRCLTLYPAWAWAIMHLDKRCENRSYALPAHVAPLSVLLHAGTLPPIGKMLEELEGLDYMAERAGWTVTSRVRSPHWFMRFQRDSVIVETGSRPESERFRPMVGSALLGTMTWKGQDAPDQGDLEGWRVPGQHGWRFDFKALDTPVPNVKGMLGFWRYVGSASVSAGA
jgi:hypothetical protein